MSRKRAGVYVVLSFLAGAALAGWVGWHYYRRTVEAHYYRMTNRSSTYVLLDNGTSLRRLKREWRSVLRGSLEEDLARPRSGMADDARWGIAYSVLRNTEVGSDAWLYDPSMGLTREDEVIRYLCFRIEHGRGAIGWPATPEFRALASYPPPALARNGPKIQRTIKSALHGPVRLVSSYAQEFLAAQLAHAWAQELAFWFVANSKHVVLSGGRRLFLGEALGKANGGDAGAQAFLRSLVGPRSPELSRLTGE